MNKAEYCLLENATDIINENLTDVLKEHNLSISETIEAADNLFKNGYILANFSGIHEDKTDEEILEEGVILSRSEIESLFNRQYFKFSYCLTVEGGKNGSQ